MFRIPAEKIRERYEKLKDFRNLMNMFDPNGKFRNHFLDTYIWESEKKKNAAIKLGKSFRMRKHTSKKARGKKTVQHRRLKIRKLRHPKSNKSKKISLKITL